MASTGIRIHATVEVKPDRISEFVELGKPLVEGTRKEPGCLLYEVRIGESTLSIN